MHRLQQVVLFLLLRNSFLPHQVFHWHSRQHVAFCLSFGLDHACLFSCVSNQLDHASLFSGIESSDGLFSINPKI